MLAAQRDTEPGSMGHVHVPLLTACENPSLEAGRGGGFPTEIALAPGRWMPRPCQHFCWCGATAAEQRAGKCAQAKNQCEGINQGESERLKKSRGSGEMCVMERGFLYLHGPPRLPSCQDKPAEAKTFCTPKQITVCWMGTL